MKHTSFKLMLVSILIAPMVAFCVTLIHPAVTSVDAIVVCGDGTTIEDGAKCADNPDVPQCLFGSGCAFTSIVNTALFIIGAISVLMLIYGGIRYTTSGGSEKSVTAAKNTILYAVVGIIVAVLAFAIVNFVLTALTGTSSGG
jgi:lysylphosphatidylglycerol synthetase-like protein (DUF2156 family)